MIHVARLLNWEYCAAHIWCWPTPVVTIVRRVARGPRIAESRSMAYCGRMASSRLGRSASGRLLAPGVDLPQPVGVAAAGAGVRARVLDGVDQRRRCTALRRRRAIGMWATLFLLISDGSMSMWTILPCLANSLELAGHAVVEPDAEGQQQVGSLMA